MKRVITRRDFLTRILAYAAGASVVTPLTFAAAPPRACPPGELVYSDLSLYRRAFERAERSFSRVDAFQEYLNLGSPGLAAYARTYQVTASSFAERLETHPDYFAELASVKGRILALDSEIRATIQNLEAVAPYTPRVPVYFFVGVLGHGATPREVSIDGEETCLGVLIPVELVGQSDGTNLAEFQGVTPPSGPERLPWLVAHELGHVAQIELQGLEPYRRIYTDRAKGTHLAYAIREGSADLLANLATGNTTDRHDYVMANERRLWDEFSPLIASPAAGSTWFGGTTYDMPERPPALGYAIGWAICKHYLAIAENSDEALRKILSATTTVQFEVIAEPYVALMRARDSSGL